MVKCRALFDFTADDSSQISLATGDIVEVVEEDESGWSLATNSNGDRGYVPSNFVEAIPAAAAPAPPPPPPKPKPAAEPVVVTPSTSGDTGGGGGASTIASPASTKKKDDGGGDSSEDDSIMSPLNSGALVSRGGGGAAAALESSPSRTASSVSTDDASKVARSPSFYPGSDVATASVVVNRSRLTEYQDLSAKLAKGIADMESMVAWLNKRSELAAMFGKGISDNGARLGSLARGTLKDACERVQSCVITVGGSHSQSASQFGNMAQATAQSTQELKTLSTKCTQEVTSLQTQLKQHTDKHNAALTSFRKACAELNTSIDATAKAEDEGQPNTTCAKLAAKSVALYINAHGLNEKYRVTLDALVQFESKYDEDMRAHMKTLVALEKRRTEELLATLQQAMAMEQMICTESTTVAEQTVATMGEVDLEKDSALFVENVEMGKPDAEHTQVFPCVVQEKEWTEFAVLPHPRKCGMLSKQGRSGLRTWKTRYFVLQDRLLYYFKLPQNVTPSGSRDVVTKGVLQGVVSVAKCTVRVVQSNFGLAVEQAPELKEKELNLRCVSASEQNSWIEAINEAIRSKD